MSDSPTRGMRVDFVVSGTLATAVFRELSKTAHAGDQGGASVLNLASLDPYYREEFKKIHDSRQDSAGKRHSPSRHESHRHIASEARDDMQVKPKTSCFFPFGVSGGGGGDG